MSQLSASVPLEWSHTVSHIPFADEFCCILDKHQVSILLCVCVCVRAHVRVHAHTHTCAFICLCTLLSVFLPACYSPRQTIDTFPVYLYYF